MKKVLSLVLAVCLAPYVQAASLRVLACEPEWAELTRVIGGAEVEVFSATDAFSDPHHIQARPSLLAMARRADLLVCTGAELEEGWLPVVLEQSNRRVIQPGQLGHFLAADQISLSEKPKQVDRSMGDIHAAGNPHFFNHPAKLLGVAEALSQRLQQLDPARSAFYRQRLAAFRAQLEPVLSRISAQLARLKSAQWVSHHSTHNEFFRWAGLHPPLAYLEPKPGLEPSISHLAQLLNRLKTQPIQAVIHSSHQPPKAAQWLGNKLGVPVITLPMTLGAKADTGDFPSYYQALANSLTQAQP